MFREIFPEPVQSAPAKAERPIIEGGAERRDEGPSEAKQG